MAAEQQDIYRTKPDRDTWLIGLTGIVIPLAVAALGAYCAITRHAYVPTHRPAPGSPAWVPMDGIGAVGIGTFLICAALWLHFRFYWGAQQDRLAVQGEGGETLSIVGMCISALLVAWGIISLFTL